MSSPRLPLAGQLTGPSNGSESLAGVRGADSQSTSGCQKVKLSVVSVTSVNMDTETQDGIFRPWDNAGRETEDSKQMIVKQTIHSKHLLRPKLEPSVSVRPLLRPKLEPPDPVRGEVSPLSIAMRGLLPPLPLPLGPHLMQLQQLQLAVASVTERKSRPKKYKCEECSACFSNNGQLRGHLRIHTGLQSSQGSNTYFSSKRLNCKKYCLS